MIADVYVYRKAEFTEDGLEELILVERGVIGKNVEAIGQVAIIEASQMNDADSDPLIPSGDIHLGKIGITVVPIARGEKPTNTIMLSSCC